MDDRNHDMEYPTVEALEAALRDDAVCGPCASEADITAGKILICSAFVGETPEQLAIASGMDIEDVNRIVGNLISAGVFGKGIDHKEYLQNNNTAWMTLMLDINCGNGYMMRSAPKPDGEPTWKLSTEGNLRVAEDILPSNSEARELIDSMDEAEGLPRGTTRRKIINASNDNG